MVEGSDRTFQRARPRRRRVRQGQPKAIAQSLKRSAEHSKRRKGTPLQSAMGMLNLYINRAGRNLPKTRRARLEKAKDELRAAFHKD